MSGIILLERKNLKEWLIALYLFQFGFMQLAASLVNSQWPIVVSTLIICIGAVWSNEFKIKRYNVVILLGVATYMMLNIFVTNIDYLAIISVLFAYITKCFSGVYVGSLDINEHKLYKVFLKVAVFNFVMIGIYPFVDFLDSMNYMRFGYAMLPSFLMFMIAAIKEKNKIIWIVLLGCSFVEILIYGNRGPLVCILIFALLIIIFTLDIKIYSKVIIGFFIIIGIVVVYEYEILVKVIDYLYLNYGHQSYSIRKLNMMLERGVLESSSGRDRIYLNIIDAFRESVIWGRGVGYAQYTWDLTAHNIILQIMLESGIVGLLFWGMVSIKLMYKYWKSRKNKFIFYIFTMLVSISLGRLSVSSDLWLRTELWLIISMLINYKVVKRYN